MGKRTSVYVYQDIAGRVIYVGITDRGGKRGEEHSRSSAWWNDVASMSVLHCSSREHALAAERTLIRLLKPPNNVIHNNEDPIETDAFTIYDAVSMFKAKGRNSRVNFQVDDSTLKEQLISLDRRTMYETWLRLPVKRKVQLGCISCGEPFAGKAPAGPSCVNCYAEEKAVRARYSEG